MTVVPSYIEPCQFEMSTAIDYDHEKNGHSIVGAELAFEEIRRRFDIQSVLDVGCGPGTWLRAALNSGTTDILGIDGVTLQKEELHFPADKFRNIDLRTNWSLNRSFDVALCVEVAEHLDETHALSLVECLTSHANVVVFSAAAPGQPGQHHVNCQWPSYWQQLFNRCGFVCSDEVRWTLWSNDRIEPWYRQNLMICTCEPDQAGHEPRIRSVIHPAMGPYIRSSLAHSLTQEHTRQIESGSQTLSWYLKTPFFASIEKLRRKFRS